jgi:hypothetical protein
MSLTSDYIYLRFRCLRSQRLCEVPEPSKPGLAPIRQTLASLFSFPFLLSATKGEYRASTKGGRHHRPLNDGLDHG